MRAAKQIKSLAARHVFIDNLNKLSLKKSILAFNLEGPNRVPADTAKF